LKGRSGIELRVVKPTLENAVANDVNPPGEPELAHRVGFVEFYGLDTDFQPVRDVLVAVSDRDEAQDLRFAIRDGRIRGLATIEPPAE